MVNNCRKIQRNEFLKLLSDIGMGGCSIALAVVTLIDLAGFQEVQWKIARHIFNIILYLSMLAIWATPTVVAFGWFQYHRRVKNSGEDDKKV